MSSRVHGKVWRVAFGIACGLLLVSGAPSGCYRKMSISIERSGDKYVLRFKTGGQDAGVRALFVSTLQEGSATDSVCEWHAQLPLHPVVGTWIYGDPLPGEYQSNGCAPLTPGLYRIQAVGFGGGGILNVQIDPAGNVQSP
jgi:hypothetical protein